MTAPTLYGWAFLSPYLHNVMSKPSAPFYVLLARHCYCMAGCILVFENFFHGLQ